MKGLKNHLRFLFFDFATAIKGHRQIKNVPPPPPSPPFTCGCIIVLPSEVKGDCLLYM